jgi:type II secretory pathway pseudopilin PulG
MSSASGVTDAAARRERRVELLGTILLAVAAVATAWSTSQSTRWRVEQTRASGKANTARTQASEAFSRAGQLTQVDIATFVQWVDASVGGKPRLARFYRERFRPEFKPAFSAWLSTSPLTNPSAPLTPFSMPQYRVAEAVKSERLNAVAHVHSAAGDKDLQHADDYLLALVLFATSLFFAAIATKIRSLRQREVLVALGWLIFIGTAVWTATIPIDLSL